MFSLFVIFWLLAIVLLCSKKSKISITGILLAILISMLMSFNTHNMDYEAYKDAYESIGDSLGVGNEYEFMYILSNRLSHMLGLKFSEFRCIYICFCVFSYYCFIKKHTVNVATCMLLYLFTGGLFDYIQLRQFGAMAIVIWGIDIVMRKNVPHRLFKFLLIILLASTFHVLSLLYLVILPCLVIKPEKQKQIYGISLIIFTIIVFVGLRTPIIYSLMSKIAGEGTASYYLISNYYTDVFVKIIIDIIVQQILLIAIIFIRDHLCCTNKRNSHEVVAILAVDALITSIMPLNILTIQFKRIARLMLIPSFSVAIPDGLISIAGNKISIKKTDMLIALWLMLYVVLYFIITLKANPTIFSDLFI